MCDIPHQWSPPCAGLVDEQSERYYQELEEIFAEMRIIQAHMSIPLCQYQCCNVTWWTVPANPNPYSPPTTTTPPIHCFVCMNQQPRAIPLEEQCGYAMFKCDECSYTWAGADPRATRAQLREQRQQCQRNSSAVGMCTSQNVSLMMIGPLQSRLAFQRFHWLRRRLWRMTNNVQSLIAAPPSQPLLVEQPVAEPNHPIPAAASSSSPRGVIRRCPRPSCGFVGTYGNGDAKRCQKCKRPVFSDRIRIKNKK